MSPVRNNQVGLAQRSTAAGKNLSGGAFAHKIHGVGNAHESMDVRPDTISEARPYGVLARNPQHTRDELEALARRLENSDRMLTEVDAIVAEGKFSAFTTWDVSAHMSSTVTGAHNDYPKGTPGLRKTCVALEASGARFANSWVREDGKLMLNMSYARPVVVDSAEDGRLKLMDNYTGEWSQAEPGQTDASLWNDHIGQSVDSRATKNFLSEHCSTGKIEANFDDETGSLNIDWIDPDTSQVFFAELTADGELREEAGDGKAFRAAFSRGEPESFVRGMITEQAIKARRAAVWAPEMRATRGQWRDGKLKDRFEYASAFYKTRESVEASGASFSVGRGYAAIRTSGTGYWAEARVDAQGNAALRVNGAPVTSFDRSQRKAQKLMEALESHRDELADLAEASNNGIS